MPPQNGTVAPESGADGKSPPPPVAAAAGSDDDFEEFMGFLDSGVMKPKASDVSKATQATSSAVTDLGDTDTVMARNKYTDVEEAIPAASRGGATSTSVTVRVYEDYGGASAKLGPPPKDDEEVDAAHARTLQKVDYPPSFWTNDRGNLKAVSFVVRRPCLIFVVIIALCLVINFALQALVFRKGNPFTVPQNEFDLGDVRSVQYDSFRLAKDQVQASKKAAELAGDKSRRVEEQSESAAIAYWVFEAETDKGVFGTRESIQNMKDAYDIFVASPEWKDWCVLDYSEEGGGFGRPGRNLAAAAREGSGVKGWSGELGRQGRMLAAAHEENAGFGRSGRAGRTLAETNGTAPEEEEEEERECRAPLTPLTMYYPSEWDAELADAVIAELEDPEKLQKFNELALCWLSQSYCELLPAEQRPPGQGGPPVPAPEGIWAAQLGGKIFRLTSKWDMEGELVDDVDKVTKLASLMIEVDLFKGFVDFGMDKGFSKENPVSMFSRGIVFWGGPLDARNMTGNEEVDDEAEETEDDIRKEFIKANYLDKMNEQSNKSKHSEINSYYFMTAIIGDVILEIVVRDAYLAIFSFAFIFFWLTVNTRSWFLALVGLLEIMFSIPISWFIFTVVFQIKYFATLNSLALFVVAAIGADDIFIFMDAYKQSRYHPEVLVDLETRMSWVYRRTGTAMAITSATTCAAFLCTLITPLPSIQSFGIFAAVVIFIDYVLVMTLFCTAVVIYHNRFENNAPFGCCCPCGLVRPDNTERARTALEGTEGEVKRDRVSEFFKNQVAGFVQTPMVRAGLGVAFSVWLGIAIWKATQLEATKENEQFLDEEHPLQKSFTILGQEFPTADDDLGLKVYYAWGVDEVDRSGVNRLLDPEDYGSPQFASDFNFDKQCQTELLAFCDRLRTAPEYAELVKRKDGLGQVNCFMEEFAAYSAKGGVIDDQKEHCEYVQSRGYKDAEWQVDPAAAAGMFPDFLKQKSCLDENDRETIGERYSDEIGWSGADLQYVAVAAESKVLSPFGRDSELLTRGEYDQFVDIANRQELTISKACGGEVVMTDLREKFVFMNNQSIYVRSAVQSAVLGVCIAFAVLLISTRVFHLAFFASLSILSVLVSVVGTMVMLGYSLGSFESILIGILAGFSVDYVVHLAHAYEIASGDTYQRVTEAFSDLGISVFNGMITSVAASIPLFFCQLQFFAKFGTFLCLTIAFSWIFANFGFMSVLAQLKIPLKEKKGTCAIRL